MIRILFAAVALAVSTMAASPALAGWNLIERNQPVSVAQNTLSVTPREQWNQWTRRPIRKSEVWTRDGVSLNQIYFVAALAPGETLFKDVAKKDRPLPKLGGSLQLTDIPDFFESSIRISLNTSVFELTGIEPATFAGRPGVKFTFEYAVEGTALRQRGMAAGTLVGDALYLIAYTAPSVFYYDRDLAEAEAIIASAAM
ncbi:MAG: hypothetical protein KDE49_01650 [Novosphingobium sp.]|nr:hypothetical protein [Novosphingobium sp.]